MTAFSKIGNKKYSKRNKKDGARQSKPADPGADFEKAGFTFIAPPAKWAYTGKMPVFHLAPGTLDGQTGLVARCGQTEILFGYGTPPAEIASVLDDIIYDDLTADPEEIDWDEWESTGLVINF